MIEESMIMNILYLLGAYCIGAIPTGYIIARLKGISDIKKYGSGNIGATNVARILGLKYFFIVFMLDALKAYLYLFFLSYQTISQPMLLGAALLLLVGNSFSVFLHWKGGKGIATSFGILAVYSLPLFMLFLIVWLVVFMITRVSGTAAIISLFALPLAGLFFVSDTYLIKLILFISIWCLWQHQDNIKKFVGQ